MEKREGMFDREFHLCCNVDVGREVLEVDLGHYVQVSIPTMIVILVPLFCRG